MIRLNVQLDDDLGKRLQAYCDKRKATKVAVVSDALIDFLDTQDVREQLLERMKDPTALVEISKALGVNLDKKSSR